VTAEATTLRVQVLAGGVVLADVACGGLQAGAGAPAAPPAPVPAAAAVPVGGLPVTGINAGWLVGLGLLVVIGGRLLVVLSRRRAR
jgi:LPXTG-motif cell wall-anchored protein